MQNGGTTSDLDQSDDSGETGDSGNDGEHDNVPSRARRHSKKLYHSDSSPTQLRFYPSQWKDVLEKAKDAYALLIFIKFGFKTTEKDLSEATACLAKALAEHEGAGRRVEAGMFLFIHSIVYSSDLGYYPTYAKDMARLVCPLYYLFRNFLFFLFSDP